MIPVEIILATLIFKCCDVIYAEKQHFKAIEIKLLLKIDGICIISIYIFVHVILKKYILLDICSGSNGKIFDVSEFPTNDRLQNG